MDVVTLAHEQGYETKTPAPAGVFFLTLNFAYSELARWEVAAIDRLR
jgi:hypothetical protein